MICKKLSFARQRMCELEPLAAGEFTNDLSAMKHQLVQEYFFHLIGAVDYASQYINNKLDFGIAIDDVKVWRIIKKLKGNDKYKALSEALCDIYTETDQVKKMPRDPYLPKSLIWRAYKYRHRVTHWGFNSFIYKVYLGSRNVQPEICLPLDIYADNPIPSNYSIMEDLEAMYEYFYQGCMKVVSLTDQLVQ
jgi:hypothetical protein